MYLISSGRVIQSIGSTLISRATSLIFWEQPLRVPFVAEKPAPVEYAVAKFVGPQRDRHSQWLKLLFGARGKQC
jgi:hypothetical protein